MSESRGTNSSSGDEWALHEGIRFDDQSQAAGKSALNLAVDLFRGGRFMDSRISIESFGTDQTQ